MIRFARSFGLRRWFAGALAMWVAVAVVILSGIAEPVASAAQPPVALGTAAAYAVLAGSTVTNTGHSIISGDLGVDPGAAVTGFPPGTVIHGTIHAADAEALQAQSNLTTAYLSAAGRTPFIVDNTNLGGHTLVPGVYKATSGMALTGTVTLDAHGDANAVFIFQAASTLIVSSSSTVKLTGGANACNVFWQVTSSATLNTGDTFVGTIMALTSASLKTGASVDGRVLARNGEVSLEDNTISVPTCAATTTTTTTTTAASSTTTTTTLSGTTVPVPPTGEPWAGWPYWMLASLAGIFGVASVERAVRIRRRRS